MSNFSDKIVLATLSAFTTIFIFYIFWSENVVSTSANFKIIGCLIFLYGKTCDLSEAVWVKKKLYAIVFKVKLVYILCRPIF